MPFFLCNAQVDQRCKHFIHSVGGLWDLPFFFQLAGHLEVEAKWTNLVKRFLLHQFLFGTNIHSDYAETLYGHSIIFQVLSRPCITGQSSQLQSKQGDVAVQTRTSTTSQRLVGFSIFCTFSWQFTFFPISEKSRMGQPDTNSTDKMNFTKEQDIQDRHKQYRQDKFHQRTRHTR
jgi:hypothetical protein